MYPLVFVLKCVHKALTEGRKGKLFLENREVKSGFLQS